MPDRKLNPVIETILRGETFKGRAYVVNDWYITAYEPILDESQKVVGVLYVGIPQENIRSLRKAITETKIGNSGFVTVMDSSGTYIISHENERGESDVVTSKNNKGRFLIKERVKIAKNLSPKEIGNQQYTFTGPNSEPILRDARFVYFEPWDWVITAEANEADFTRASALIAEIGARGNVFIGIVSIILLVIFIVILCFVSNSITRPIKGLVRVFEEYGRGNTKIRAEANSKDEIGYFATGFNTMLDRIDAGARTIKESEFAYRKLFNQLQDAIETNRYDFRFANDVKRVELIGSLNQMLETLENADRETANQSW